MTADTTAAPAGAGERNKRRTLSGVVTSAKMEKTVTVLIERTYKHPKYGKYVRRNKKMHVHDAKGDAKVGDKVEIVATRPISKIIRWRVVRVLEAALDRGVDVASAAGTGLAEQAGIGDQVAQAAQTAPDGAAGSGAEDKTAGGES